MTWSSARRTLIVLIGLIPPPNHNRGEHSPSSLKRPI
jgi:hypothetical protein